MPIDGVSWAEIATMLQQWWFVLSGYLTWAPRVGRRDAERNCVSNIRPSGGLGYDAAAHTLIYLILEAQRRRLTGVELKDESAGLPSLLGAAPTSRAPGNESDA